MQQPQFRDKLPPFDTHAFHTGDTVKNPVIFPHQWLDPPAKTQPTIPHIVGVIVIGIGTAYALFEAAWLLIKAFLLAVR
jgi:hypothetical protein